MTCERCGKEIPPACLSVEYEFHNDDHLKVTARCTECYAEHIGYLGPEDIYLEEI